MRAIMEQAVVQVADLEEDREFRNQRLTRAAGIRSMIAIPLRREGVTIGAFAVARAEVGCFADGLIELLTTFADQAVIAIENVRLFTELQEKNRALTEAHGQVSQALERQTATAEILHVISRAQMDVQPVFEAIADSAMRLFGAFGVYVFCSDGELIHLAAARGGLPGSSDASIAQWRVPRRPQADGLVFRVLRTRRMQQILDVETDTTVPPELCEDARRRGWRSSVQVPMLRGDDVLGTIAVSRAEPGGLSPAEIALLQTFADQAVIAVENVRLLTELQARTAQLTRSVDQLTALGEVGQAVSSSLDLETVLTTIVSRAVQLSGLDGGVIFEYDEAAEEFTRRAATAGEAPALAEVRRGARIRKGEGVLGRTAVTLAPVQVEDIAVEGAYEGRLREPLLDAGVRALLAVPMLREGRLLGGLVVNRRQPGAFPAETVDLLRTFATQSALAIQNARLFQEIEAKGRELQAASQHKSDFLANMSHELRTPLNAIIGYSEMLQEEAQDRHQDSFVPDLEKINAAAKHQLSLINDILDLSKVEAGRMELEVTEFDLLGAIDNALTLVRERATRRGIALGSATDGGVGSIRADERKVKQVLLNLLSNALKFTPEGGRIEVCATLTEGTIEVSVSDTGVGIAPEDHEAVFEEFRQVGTADKKVEGTGLGLALCRRFVELHGGRIWVTSQAGRGSTFTFTLPV